MKYSQRFSICMIFTVFLPIFYYAEEATDREKHQTPAELRPQDDFFETLLSRIESLELTKLKFQIIQGKDLCNKGYFLSALQLFDSIERKLEKLQFYNNAHTKQEILLTRADLLLSLAGIYQIQGHQNRALQYCFEALNIAKNYDNKTMVGESLSCLGVIYFNMRDFQNSRKFLLGAREICYENLRKRLFVNYYLAMLYLNQSEDKLERDELSSGSMYQKAEFYLDDAIKINSKYPDNKHTSYILLAKANLLKRKGEYKQAAFLIEKELSESIRKGEKYLELDCRAKLIELYKKMGNYRLAYLFLKVHTEKVSELIKKENRQQLADMEIAYKTRQKDVRIKMLKKNAVIEESKKKFTRILYVALLAFVAFLFGALFLFRHFRNERQKRRLESKIIESELQAVRMQMNPHFVFNCLSGIKYLIDSKNDEKARQYLICFSRLMRLNLEKAIYSWISIDDELEMLEEYLRLEQFRFREKFQFNLNLLNCDNLPLDSIKIPSMMIQPHLENAILHGILPKKSNGEINLTIQIRENIVEVVIDDNGVGRNSSRSGRTHISTAMNNFKTRMNLLFIQGFKLSQFLIEDKKTKDGISLGTTVIFSLPAKSLL